jgi:hypothetical protein
LIENEKKSIINSLSLCLVLDLCTHNENYNICIVHVLEFSKKEHAREALATKKRKGRPRGTERKREERERERMREGGRGRG